jgi:hypothetical protein
MPFKSKAQRRKLHSMASKGEISRQTVDEWEDETKGKLPERVEKKPKVKSAEERTRERLQGTRKPKKK